MTTYKLSEIVAKFGGALQGEDLLISGVASIKSAVNGQIIFFSDKKFKDDLIKSLASAVIIRQDDADLYVLNGMSKIIAENPYLYFSRISQLFNSPRKLPIGIKKSATIAPDAKIENDCGISENVVIGGGVYIGKNCQIYPNVVIYPNVKIGDNSILHANIVVYSNVTIGQDCEIHSGAIIGSDGFGYVKDNNKEYNKIPQIGGVRIGNKVSIGANTTIDSGALDPTIIEDGVIIDNLVQIGHNVIIGAHTAISGCVAIAGSTKIGKYCTLAGGAKITGHINICDHSIIGGATVISKSINTPDLYMSVYPFSGYKEYAKNAIRIRSLNDMAQKIKLLQTQLTELLKKG